MPIEPGQTLLHYRLDARIGEGGMGVVWKATDTTLDREVALKILPDAFAADPERLSRFEREAKLLASLNHSGIAVLHGLHEAEGVRFITMELVPGEDLAQRLERGPFAIDEALDIALQVAHALEAAHERNVIHRDLKPANVKLTPEGKVKVLDFGLAKALAPEAGPAGSGEASASLSPTVTSAGTLAGVILGTASYMSPEQARGRPVDRRADIWAFGAVLWELLTGRRPFDGETVSDILAGVLRIEPEWRLLPDGVPRPVERLLRRCLDKDPQTRLRDIGEARVAIERMRRGEADEAAAVDASVDAAGQPATRRGVGAWLPWALLGVMVVAVLVSQWTSRTGGHTATQTVMRFQVRDVGADPVLSPDGTHVAYVDGPHGTLHVRPIDSVEARELPGTEGAAQPFFSPDGKWLGFFSDRKLRKVSLGGGAPVPLADATVESRGGSWGPDGTIVYAPSLTGRIWRVSEGGGDAEPLTELDTTVERGHRWPWLLPGGRAALFTAQPVTANFQGAGVDVIDLETKERKQLVDPGSYGRYVPTGHLVYANGTAMLAVRFDPESLTVSGTPLPVIGDCAFDDRNGYAEFSFSETGVLLHGSGVLKEGVRRLIETDLDGNRRPLEEEPAGYANFRFSPDGDRLALAIRGGGGASDLWIRDMRRDTMTRLTFHDSRDMRPVWSPDGKTIVFSSLRDGATPNLHTKAADGSGAVERLSTSENAQFATDWSADGRVIAFAEERAATGFDLRFLVFEDDGSRREEDVLATPYEELDASFSPDGRWLAYVSDESGRREVYVRGVESAGTSGKWQVTRQGGTRPRWTPDGKRIWFGRGGVLLGVDVRVDGGSFSAGGAVVMMEGLGAAGDERNLSETRAFDFSPVRGVVVTTDSEEAPEGLGFDTVVVGWFGELRWKVGGR